jgi:hypothetical protein
VNCEEVLRELATYLDREAREDLCREIEGHLARCKDCSIHVDSLKKTIVLYQHERQLDMPASISQRLQAALDQEYEVVRLQRKAD